MIRLKLHVGDDSAPRDFADETILIGRSPANHLVISDPRVSRQHARIERAGAAVRLVDLLSGNGTRWNGRRIESAFLKAGDEVEIGRARLRVLGVEAADPLQGLEEVMAATEGATTTVQPAASPPRARRLSRASRTRVAQGR